MGDFNKFFKKLATSPSLLWKAGAGFIFFCFAIVFLAMPSLTPGFTDGTRLMLGLLMMAYALFRFYSCYAEYKSYENE